MLQTAGWYHANPRSHFLLVSTNVLAGGAISLPSALDAMARRRSLARRLAITKSCSWSLLGDGFFAPESRPR